ncbi:hypothetical protein TNCV_579521 [Trichonephila clavipes]|nr:hypothetical protein TNCV_579521 [Trichonephila clavipes]
MATEWACLGSSHAKPVEVHSQKVMSGDSDENIRFNESDCEEFEESADAINNPVNPNTSITRFGTECIPHNNNVPGIFATPNILRQSSE